ncbi:MAG: MFS family permease [Candidatus Krumholzibacteriia bacterium]
MNKPVESSRVAAYPAHLAWLGLVVVYCGSVTVGFVFHFLPPVLTIMIDELKISHGQAGLLMSVFAFPGVLLSLPGGWLVDRYGERLVGGVGLALMGLGTYGIGLAPSYNVILLARLLSGVGVVVGVLALQRLVVRLFRGRSMGLALGLSASALPLGVVVVLNFAGEIAASDGWREVARQVGSVSFVMGLIFIAVISYVTRGHDLGRDHMGDDTGSVADRPNFRPIWIAGAAWFCANGSMTTFLTFGPDYYQHLGFAAGTAGSYTAIPMWTSATLGTTTGWITERYGGRASFIAAGMFLMGLALIVLPSQYLSPVLIGLMLGFSMAAVVTPLIALPGILLPSTHTGRGYGILATCANLGILLVPPLAGFARDTSSSYTLPYLLVGGLGLLGAVAAEILRRSHCVPGLLAHRR